MGPGETSVRWTWGSGLPRAASWVLRALPWLLCAWLLASHLHTHGTTTADLTRYAVYLSAGLVLPGALAVRVLLPRPRPFSDDVVLGAAVGMAMQLLLLALVVTVGHPAWLRWWPALVVLAVLLVPRLRSRLGWPAAGRVRRRGTADQPHRTPVWWHWGAAAAVGVAGTGAVRGFLSFPLPPGEGVHYVDLPWHLALVHAVTRSVPPEVPQVAGSRVEYHWFANGDMAAASVVSGVPEAVVLLRMWPVSVVALGVLLVAALARVLSGSWAGGLVAAWLFAATRGLKVLPAAFSESPIVVYSPSHGYVVVVTLAAMVIVVGALRGQSLGRGGWLLLVLLLAAAGGGKPAALPTLACGAALAAAAALVVHRRRSAAAPALGVLLACALLLPVTATLFSGSDSQSSIRLFAFMRWHEMYRALRGSGVRPMGQSVEDVVGGLGASVVAQIAVMLLVALVVTHLGLLLGAAAFTSRTVRRDPVAWFFAGAIGSSFAAYALVAHPSYSQVYFVRLALAHGAAVLAWVLVGAARRVAAPRRVRLVLVATGTVLGAALAWLTGLVAPALVDASDRQSLLAWRSAFIWSFLVVVGGLAAVALGCHLVARRRPTLRGSAVAVLAAAVILGAPAYAVRTTPLDRAVEAWRGIRVEPVQKPRNNSDIPLPRGGGAAMHWLDRNTPPDAVVATNRHCSRGTPASGCRSNLYLVSGLGGRQAVLESWAYVGVLGGPTDADPYPERLAANDALFTAPTAEGFARMKREYGLSWLVADSTATAVAPDLTRYATRRFSAGTVTIYEVR